ncbi:translation initiation factor eIF4E [Saguinus oedipus]|uniref:Translation initiation factor eIF4E n=1 Tax=Saguinus oedipus TaxID=9490 RepID=A0ABQ9W6R9_SAGOE|nr:translation initiation factor eIF4E [Saguinus oedipus]
MRIVPFEYFTLFKTQVLCKRVRSLLKLICIQSLEEISGHDHEHVLENTGLIVVRLLCGPGKESSVFSAEDDENDAIKKAEILQESEALSLIDSTEKNCSSEVPAWYIYRLSVASLFGSTKDEHQPERAERGNMETTPTPNPPAIEEEKPESNQEVANPEHYIKHPLQNRFSDHLHGFNLQGIRENIIQLELNLLLVDEIHLPHNRVFQCVVGSSFLRTDGIEPMWEDEKNKRGGRWLITLNKQQRRSDLDRFWLETLLCLIGESFDDYSDDVCGAVVNVRAKGDKIAIWTTECENREAVTHIGRVYKERLGLPPKIVIGYQSHADTATKSGSTTKNSIVFAVLLLMAARF